MASLLVLLMCGYITALPFKLFKHRIKRIKQICLTEGYIKQSAASSSEFNEYKNCRTVLVKFVKLKINLLIFNLLV